MTFLAGAPKVTIFSICGIFDPQMAEKKVEIEGVGPIWRDPRRNSASKSASNVQNGAMASCLVEKGLIWVPLRFRSQLAHLRALLPGPCCFPHFPSIFPTPKIVTLRCGGIRAILQRPYGAPMRHPWFPTGPHGRAWCHHGPQGQGSSNFAENPS